MSVHSFCNIFLYPRQKLGSLRGGLAEKTTWIREAWQRDPSIDKTICSSITLEKNDETWMSKVGRTNTAWLQKVPVTEYLLSHSHTEPYTMICRCRSQAIHALQHLGPQAVSTRSNWGQSSTTSPPSSVLSQASCFTAILAGWVTGSARIYVIHP